ncbi:hypothetical protein SRB5_67790 [Streptomyces sp. RB5]|uniref:PadR family transcriptional regulator n=1 Tax=Streptomyces smaragdinus TaxID=2585196 RepID=A0A7K0CT15_9ACTN|nr:helix-turn-helix transcriptional regulator [Streptomyces smaragdinus]MQY16578.1 hypothetical protein [Streptomyces smaragdinus]
MSLKYALLGVLTARPMNGYALSRYFAGSHYWVWTASQSQIYSSLKTLESSGLIEATSEEGLNGLESKVYAITGQGRDAFIEWAGSPHKLTPTRDAFGLQALYFDAIDPADAREIVDQFIAGQEELLAEWREQRALLAAKATPLLKERLAQLPPETHDRVARLKAHVFDGLIKQAEDRIAWARETYALLGD